jgi:hypothetical protein
MQSASPFRPPVFAPSQNQRRWVRDRFARIRGRRGWVHFVRVDRPVSIMIDAPWGHEDVGEWERRSVSIWQCPCVGAEFASIAEAVQWVEAIPGPV